MLEETNELRADSPIVLFGQVDTMHAGSTKGTRVSEGRVRMQLKVCVSIGPEW